MAVGRTPGGASYTPLALLWNGSRWSRVATPAPMDQAVNLQGVSCASTYSCVAVGYLTGSNGFRPYAEHWDGKKWATGSVPTPAKHSGTVELTSVSCASAKSCMAVGYNYSGSRRDGSAPVTAAWNGAKWKLISAPKGRSQGLTTLYGVSCAGPARCVSVGRAGATPFDSSGAMLAQMWNGSSWRVMHTPTPARGKGNQLQSVSCPSPARCIAVGQGGARNYPGASLAKRWNTKAWSTMRMS